MKVAFNGQTPHRRLFVNGTNILGLVRLSPRDVRLPHVIFRLSPREKRVGARKSDDAQKLQTNWLGPYRSLQVVGKE
jgi:hypothetical protein